MDLVIGLGTGRCGSLSFAKLMNSQKDVTFTHEVYPLPWIVSETELTGALTKIFNTCRNASIGGDAGSYYLPYVEMILKTFPRTKFVCLERDIYEVVDSYLKKTPTVNHWTDCESSFWSDYDDFNNWDRCFPKYNLPKNEAIERYCWDYSVEVDRLQKTYPNNFKVYPFKKLLTKHAFQNDLKEFLNIHDWEYILNIWENKGRNKNRIKFTFKG